jgi:hypothetical protein
MPYSFCGKLDRMFTFDWLMCSPDCKLALDCAGSPRRFSSQYLQDRKCHFPYRVAREPNYNIISEWMAYYSRYATRKNCVMLGFSMLQQVTSEPGAVAIPKAQPTQSLPCPCSVLTRPGCWHWFSCAHLLFSWPFECMTLLTMHWNSSLLQIFHPLKAIPSQPCEQGIISAAVASLMKDKLPTDQEIPSPWLSWSSSPRSRYPVPILALGLSSPLNLKMRFLLRGEGCNTPCI